MKPNAAHAHAAHALAAHAHAAQTGKSFHHVSALNVFACAFQFYKLHWDWQDAGWLVGTGRTHHYHNYGGGDGGDSHYYAWCYH